jgi:hypothetical protein
MQPYEKLVAMIKEKIYTPGTTDLARGHDFSTYLG